jgi:hypothetical protein
VNRVTEEVEGPDMPYQAAIVDQDGTLIHPLIPAMHAFSVAVGREITLVERDGS